MSEHRSGDFGERLKQARKNAGLTQRGLSVATNLDVGTISRYERGDLGNPELETLKRLASALSVSADWLGSGESPTESHVERLDLDPVIEAIIAEGDWTEDEIEAMRRTNWKLLASTNYGPAFVLKVMLERRKPAPAVQTVLPDRVAKLSPKTPAK